MFHKWVVLPIYIGNKKISFKDYTWNQESRIYHELRKFVTHETEADVTFSKMTETAFT